jgi:hypothetical protein
VHGVRGYLPAGADTVDEVIGAHGVRLGELGGRRLVRVSGLCFAGDGEWCATLPIVLHFEGSRLELCMNGSHLLHLSWDTIDETAPIDDPDQDDPEMRVDWAEPADLAAWAGGTVSAVRVGEQLFTFDPVDGPRRQKWILGGLEFAFTDRPTLMLSNVFTEIVVHSGSLDPEGWRSYGVTEADHFDRLTRSESVVQER